MFGLLLVGQAFATWSIIAVDPETGEVGMAGATCGPMVWGIAGLAPGHGVVAAQYDTWVKGRKHAVAALEEGQSPSDALAGLLDEDKSPEVRQWAIVGFDSAPVGYTGAEVEAPFAIQAGDTWSVQGNTLASEDVVTSSAAAFEQAEGPLADRLVEALQAGAAEGGDHRCDPEDAAKSAFVYVAVDGDRGREPTVELRASGRGAVAELAERYAEGDRSCGVAAGRPSGLLALISLLAARRRRTLS